MRILFIAHHFQPEPNFFVGLPFAKELARRGHEVQVLTGFPNYPGGEIYDGYRISFLQKEVIDGIPIIRVPLYPSHDRTAIKRIISYLSLSIAQATIGPFAVKDADIAYISQGPATIGLPAIIHKFFRRIPFVYNIQDLWPDSLTSTGMFDHSLGLKLINRWCSCVYNQAAKITVIAPGMKTRLIARGVPEEKIELIYNWCDDDLICRDEPDHQLKDSLGLTDKFNIIFAGNIGKAQAMHTILDAAKLITGDCPKVQFAFIGDGVEVDPLKQKADNMNLTNVRFLDRRPVEEIGPILRCADVLLVHLKDDPLFRITIPSKTQAYLAMGRPVLIGVKGDAAHLIEKAQAGLTCEPENPNSMADTIKKLYNMNPSQLDQMGHNGIKFYDSNIAFKIAVGKFENIFKKII